MFGDGSLTFREYAMREPVPLAMIHQAVLDFLRGLNDVAIFGAQAVNAYVEEPRMTQDVDLLSVHASEVAAQLQEHLADRFKIAVRVREVADGRGFRLFQLRKPKDRHLVDVRLVTELPPTQRVAEVLVVSPAELIANKVVSYHARRGQPKSGTDWRDIAVLLLTFPELKSETGLVLDRLTAAGAGQPVLNVWKQIVAQEITAEDEDEGF